MKQWMYIPVFLFVLPLAAQEKDSTSVGDVIESFFGKNQPSLGTLIQLEGYAYKDTEKYTYGGDINNFRIFLSGSFARKFSYFFQGNFNTYFQMLDLVVSYDFQQYLSGDAGLLKTPFGNEYLKDEADLLFVRRSTVSENLGPLRERGGQIRGKLFENRLTYAAGLFGGSGIGYSRINEVSVLVGKLDFIPLKAGDPTVRRKLEIGLSAAYSYDRSALTWLQYSRDHKFLWGTDFRIDVDDYWLEGEIIALPRSDLTTLGGFHIDVARRITPRWEVAARFDWYQEAYLSSTHWRFEDDLFVNRNYLLGINVYPEENLKLQLDLERYQTSQYTYLTFQFQYAINDEHRY